MKLPSEILAFKLLKQANLTQEEHLLVLTGLDYTDKTTLYEQSQKSLKKFKGDQVSTSKKNAADGTTSIKVIDDAFLAQHDEALMAAGYVNRKTFHGGRGRGYRGRYLSSRERPPAVTSAAPKRNVNPTDANGKLLTCIACGSFRHMRSMPRQL